MQRTTLVAIILTSLIGIALWQQRALDVAKAAPVYSTFTVTNTADSGVGSFRQAILDANITAGADTITFDPDVFAGPRIITLTSGELAISDSVTITGPGASLLTISGSFTSRVFLITSGNYAVTLFGLSVINGRHTAPGGGGGILNFSSGTLTVAQSALSGNSANGLGASHGSGGGIYNAGNGVVALINSTLSDNSANGLAGVEIAFGEGGAIFNAGSGTVTLTNSTLSGNSANGAPFGFGFGFGEGGGIFNAGNGTVTLTNTTLSNNVAKSSVLPGSGGGVFNAGTGIVTLINTTLSDNSAVGSQGLGGGIANADGTLTLTNSTLSGNSCTGGGIGKGGGIYNKGNGTVTLTNITVAGNSVTGPIQTEGGGILNEGAGTVNVRNSLIASNFSTLLAPDVGGTFNSQGHNLIGDGRGSSGFTGSGDQVGSMGSLINPLLGQLVDNGGPTQTRALLPGSPAIDTGDNCVIDSPGCLPVPLSTDQRGAGIPRNSGGTVDIGAFEVHQIEYEADVAPRPNGSGTVSMLDWVQVGRFAVGLDTPSNGSEFQRADCAPSDTRGNGALSLADWVQAGRYAAFIDPITIAAGPTSSGSGLIAGSIAGVNRGSRSDLQRRSVMVVASPNYRSPGASVVVWLASEGVENAISFSVSFDPSKWEFVGAQVSSDAVGAMLIQNSSQIRSGRIGFALALPPGRTLAAGWRHLVDIRLRPVGGRPSKDPGVEMSSDEPIRREVVDVWGNEIVFDWLSHRQPRR